MTSGEVGHVPKKKSEPVTLFKVLGLQTHFTEKLIMLTLDSGWPFELPGMNITLQHDMLLDLPVNEKNTRLFTPI